MRRCVSVIGLVLLFLDVFSQRQLPDVTVENSGGDRYAIKEIMNDSLPVVLAFWATTCKPCIQELDALSEVLEDWKEIIDFKVVAVSTDDSRSALKVRSMAEGREWPFEILLDKNQEFKRAMNVNSIPFLFVLDRTGKVVYSHSGYTPGSEREVLNVLEKLK